MPGDVQNSPVQNAPGGVAPATPVKQAPEAPLWAGRCSPRTFWIEWVLWLVVAVVITALLLTFEGFSAGWVVWTYVILLLGSIGYLVVRHGVQYFSLGYRLTTQRLFIEKGIFSKVVDQTELIRVDDVSVRMTVFQRLLGIGDVIMTCPTDRTDDRIYIRNIADPHGVGEHIRTHVRSVRQQRALFFENV